MGTAMIHGIRINHAVQLGYHRTLPPGLELSMRPVIADWFQGFAQYADEHGMDKALETMRQKQERHQAEAMERKPKRKSRADLRNIRRAALAREIAAHEEMYGLSQK